MPWSRPPSLVSYKEISCGDHGTKAKKQISDTDKERETLAKLKAEAEDNLSKERNDHEVLKAEYAR
jgi:hypothetical protein